jgi:beta-glucosidase/6-phospho-beta-glucosidase/beta-galactosidase
MRYGIPWYRVNPAPGRFDWSWTDAVLEHMVERLGIAPIIDLVHYGCPLWMEREFLHPDYPKLIAGYAAAFVERYGRLVQSYTPLNEPLVNIRFSGYTGYWPPYRRGWRGWVALLLPIAEGMSRTVAAIRELQPEASIVHVGRQLPTSRTTRPWRTRCGSRSGASSCLRTCCGVVSMRRTPCARGSRSTAPVSGRSSGCTRILRTST